MTASLLRIGNFIQTARLNCSNRCVAVVENIVFENIRHLYTSKTFFKKKGTYKKSVNHPVDGGNGAGIAQSA
jgi:hypothetical protein